MTRTGIAVAGSIFGPSVIAALAFIGDTTGQPTSTPRTPASTPRNASTGMARKRPVDDPGAGEG